MREVSPTAEGLRSARERDLRLQGHGCRRAGPRPLRPSRGASVQGEWPACARRSELHVALLLKALFARVF